MSTTEPEHPTTITFDGTPLTSRPGQTVAAVLIDNGIRSWRTTSKNGRPRGLFCGIGACYDCLLTINGQPNQRACLAAAEAGTVCRTNPIEGEPE
ncbi:MAG TPA: (2Fe-2S)-binding protein [Ilumatobacter sp.]|nr:(2Fe-2S)-binding protein [Ilumatobacter sp.]